MKYLVLMVFLVGCTATAQDDKQSKKQHELDSILVNYVKHQQESGIIQVAARKQQAAVINKAADKIVTLKTQVTTLKTELNEVKSKLDSVHNDTGRSFVLLPISNH